MKFIMSIMRLWCTSVWIWWIVAVRNYISPDTATPECPTQEKVVETLVQLSSQLRGWLLVFFFVFLFFLIKVTLFFVNYITFCSKVFKHNLNTFDSLMANDGQQRSGGIGCVWHISDCLRPQEGFPHDFPRLSELWCFTWDTLGGNTFITPLLCDRTTSFRFRRHWLSGDNSIYKIWHKLPLHCRVSWAMLAVLNKIWMHRVDCDLWRLTGERAHVLVPRYKVPS